METKHIQEYIKNNSETWFIDLANIIIKRKQDILEQAMDTDVDLDDLHADLYYDVFEYIEDEILGEAPTDFHWV